MNYSVERKKMRREFGSENVCLIQLHLNGVWKFSIYNQINYKSMEIVINGKILMGKKANI